MARKFASLLIWAILCATPFRYEFTPPVSEKLGIHLGTADVGTFARRHGCRKPGLSPALGIHLFAKWREHQVVVP
jgi:hypothetical protein